MTYSPLAPRMLSTSVSSRLHVACRTKDNYDRVCKSLRQRYISVRENENRDTTTQNKNNHMCSTDLRPINHGTMSINP